MHSTLCPIREATPDTSYDVCASRVNNAYATEPVRAIVPQPQLPREEELYSAFEQALSDRHAALHQKLQHFSDSRVTVPLKHSHVHQPARSKAHRSIATLPRSWRLALLSGAFALIFTLLGFDLLGILLLLMK